MRTLLSIIKDEEELVGILQFVCIISFLALNQMVGMSIGFNRENEFLANLLDDLCKWCFIPTGTKGIDSNSERVG